MLGKVVNEIQHYWDDKLPAVLAAYGVSPHESTAFTPSRLFLGQEVRKTLDLLLDLPKEEREMSQSVNVFARETQEQTARYYTLAREHLGVAAERRKVSYDVKVRNTDFSVGQWV